MVRHRIAHSLTLADAQKLIERAFAHYRERHATYHPTLTWLDPHHGEIGIVVRGYKLAARIALEPDAAVVEMDVPLVLRPFQGAAVRAIDREVTRWLKSEPAP